MPLSIVNFVRSSKREEMHIRSTSWQLTIFISINNDLVWTFWWYTKIQSNSGDIYRLYFLICASILEIFPVAIEGGGV